jgi:hypothetical protein
MKRVLNLELLEKETLLSMAPIVFADPNLIPYADPILTPYLS